MREEDDDVMNQFSYQYVHHPKIGSAIGLVTPYDSDFVQELKREIPSGKRLWDAERKAWFVAEEWSEEALQIAETYFEWGEEADDLFDDLDEDWVGSAGPGPRANKDPFQPNQDWFDSDWGFCDNPGSAGAEPKQSPRRDGCSDHWTRLGLLPSADPDVARAAYRILAQKYHPDHGGSCEQMREINEAWEAIQKEINKRGGRR